jgi:hypothetical protein
MNTSHSIAIAAALFAVFLAVGMANMTANAATPVMHAGMGSKNADASSVQDREAIKVFLLYHNPFQGAITATPPAVIRSSALSN